MSEAARDTELSAPGDLAALLTAIRTGPTGPSIGAFFEFAGVVTDGLGKAPRRIDDPAAALRVDLGAEATDTEFDRRLDSVTRAFAGQAPADLDRLATAHFRRESYGHLYPEAWRLIAAHRAAGHTVVLVSPLTEFQLRPAAAELGVTHLLATRLAVTGGDPPDTATDLPSSAGEGVPTAAGDGVLTGAVVGEPPRGEAAAEAVRAFAARHGIDLARSHAYAAGSRDLPLLEAVGHPVAVNPSADLAATAVANRWPAPEFRPRPAQSPANVARTVLALLALLAGAVAGVVSRAHTRDRRAMADALMTYAARLTLRVVGARVRVVGARHARAPRPAVFLFNHQSQFDVIIMPKVLDGGVTAIAKKELTRNPIFGPLMRFVGVTFIDRSDSAGTRAQLAPVVETLHSGLSLAVAPEGTRSYTPAVGPFKKGAFHIARQAGVPIIPVVIRNAGEIAWRNSMIARPGTVDVAVLAPIDVSAWDPADLDAEVEKVRQLYLDTLLDWPKSADHPE